MIIMMMDREKTHMDAIRSQISKVSNLEKTYLAERTSQNEKSLDSTKLIIIVGTLLIQVIIVILIYFILNEFTNRKKAEQAVKENLDEVKALNELADSKNWVLSGVANINDSLQGADDIPGLSKNIVDAIVKYLRAQAGALYTINEDNGKLELQNGNSLPANATKSFNIGDGLIGSAARQNEILVINNVPADYWSLQSGTGSAKPGHILLLPLWFGNQLKGVLELASFSGFTEQDEDVLNTVANNIAIAINAVESRDKVMALLEQVQLQKIDLQNQQEELRQTNEELTRQAEVLQASEEELRVQEEELRQINAELEEKNEAVEVSRQALSQKARELEVTGKYKSEFLANMSHELRTPLNSVLILAKILSENKPANLTDKQVEYANIIHKSGTDLLTLINDILDLSKIEAGKIDLNIEDVKIDHVLRDIGQTFYVVAEEKSINFIKQKADNLPETITTDKVRLEQVIKNMLSNAFKFTPKDGTVTLEFKEANKNGLFEPSLKNAEHVLEISVTDTGIGIPEEKQQLIFEAFQQADGSTSRKYGGTGLGLSISKELIKKLGGEMKLKSQEGKGSTFSIFIPLDHVVLKSTPQVMDQTPATDVEPLLKDVVEQTRIADDRNNIQKGDSTILIIEDDPQFARIVQDFAKSKNYKTIVALQGDEGLYYARKYKPSAIVLDIQLPVIDGWSVLKIIKADEKLKHIPVHIMSATDVDKSGGSALAFLKKPLEKDDLENAFTLLGTHIKSDIKKLLILSADTSIDAYIRQAVQPKHDDLVCDYAVSEDVAIDMLKKQTYDCVIVDIGNQLEKGKIELQHISAQVKDDEIPVILFLNEDISSKDELYLKRFSDVIIRNSSQAKDRLMDEVELFLYKVQESKDSFTPRAVAEAIDEKALQGKKVLVVDDDMRNVFALTTLLEEKEMEVITAGDGKEALAMLNEQTGIDVVLMDIMMPEMDGYEATRRLRQDRRFTHLPVIALTAKAMQGDKEKAIEAGASDYITKPIDSVRLFSLLRVWLMK
jgi:signal transduction histidine kinase/DNA-binding response OmpR family regulator